MAIDRAMTGIASLAGKVGDFFSNIAPAYAMSGVTTPYGKASPGIDATKINPRDMTAQNVGEALGINNNPPKTLDAIQNRFDYGPSVVRHPGYSGYDITQMMMGNDPEFMSRINFGQQADRQAGGGTENTLAAMQYIIDRNKTRQQEIQQQMQQQTQQYMQPNSQTGFDVTQIANLPNAYNQEAIMNNINQYGLGNLAGLMGDVNIFGSR